MLHIYEKKYVYHITTTVYLLLSFVITICHYQYQDICSTFKRRLSTCLIGLVRNVLVNVLVN